MLELKNSMFHIFHTKKQCPYFFNGIFFKKSKSKRDLNCRFKTATHFVHFSFHLSQNQILSTMTELANEFSGAAIISSSSFDPKHPPSSVIDGEYNTFWLTTGIYPQEIIVQLGEPSLIKGVELMSTGIRKVELAKSEGPSNMWETIAETESNESDSEVQRISLQAPPRVTAGCLRIKVCDIFLFNLIFSRLLASFVFFVRMLVCVCTMYDICRIPIALLALLNCFTWLLLQFIYFTPPRVFLHQITSGWADCVSLYKVSVLGTAKR